MRFEAERKSARKQAPPTFLVFINRDELFSGQYKK
jgi:hypothetical protein